LKPTALTLLVPIEFPTWARGEKANALTGETEAAIANNAIFFNTAMVIGDFLL